MAGLSSSDLSSSSNPEICCDFVSSEEDDFFSAKLPSLSSLLEEDPF
jgi:hypothetical protein